MKRLIAVILTILCLSSLGASAANALTSQPSNLTVVMKYGEEKLNGISVAVCRAADASEANGSIVYTAAPAFAAAQADFTSLTKERNIALAAALDAFAAAGNVQRSVKSTDSGGKAVFTGLPAGLYLVAQTDAGSSEYIIAPYLVAAPAPQETKGQWEYDVTAYPKTEPVKRALGSISVQKIWVGTDTPPAGVQVQLSRNGQPYASAVTLNAANHWRYTWDKLSTGDTWTVDEPDVPAGYAKAITGNASTGFVITNTRVPQAPAEPQDTTHAPVAPGSPGAFGAPEISGRPAAPGVADVTSTSDAPGGNGTVPKTNDYNHLALWLVMAGTGLAGFAAVTIPLARRGKRREANRS